MQGFAGSGQHMVTVLLATWIVLGPRKEAPGPQMAKLDIGLWGPLVFSFPFQGVGYLSLLKVGSLGPESQLSTLTAIFACSSHTFGERQIEPGPVLSPLRHVLSNLSTFPI